MSKTLISQYLRLFIPISLYANFAKTDAYKIMLSNFVLLKLKVNKILLSADFYMRIGLFCKYIGLLKMTGETEKWAQIKKVNN